MIKINRKTPYLLILLIIFLILVWRSRYGLGWNDEGFYIALVHRWYLGEAYCSHEWWLSQSFAPFLYPFYFLYINITGSNQGVYLFYRELYLVINLSIAIFIYLVFTKYNKNTKSALVAAVFVLLSSKDNILTESYYILVLQMSILSLVLVYDLYYSDKISAHNNFKMIMIGIFASIAIVGNPLLCIPYTFIIIFLLFLSVFSNKKLFINPIWIICGTIIMAITYLKFILERTSLNKIIELLPYMLFDDEHPPRNLLKVLLQWGWYAFKPFGMGTRLPAEEAKIYQFIPVIIILALCFGAVIYRHYIRYISIKIKYIITIILILGLCSYLWNMKSLVGGGLIGFSILGGIFYGYSQKRDWVIFRILYLPGIVISVFSLFVSNTGVNSMTMGFTICAVASVFFIYDFFIEECYQNMVFKIMHFFIILCIVLSVLYIRIFNVFKDKEIKDLNYEIKKGSLKGIITSEENYIKVDDIYDALTIIREVTEPEDNVLISEMLPWGYTDLDTHIGAPTVWRNALSSQKLEIYYTTFPEKKPDCIFVLNEKYGFHNDNNELTGTFKEFIENSNYLIIKVKCGTIYIHQPE